MKKFFVSALLICITIFAFTSTSSAVSITGVYDFRDQLDAATTSFEGLAFTDDGTLWITSAPNFQTPTLLEVDLETEMVLSTSTYNQFFFNPVGLASDGTNLFAANNLKSWGSSVYDVTDPSNSQYLWSATGCDEAEGAAYLNGYVYVSCEDSQNVVKIDPGTGAVVENIDFGVNLLGLGATDTSLIIGDYTNHDLLIYDVATSTITETIDLEALFPGYSVLVDGEDVPRTVPDPDGLAYRNGKIYMTFEHDLQVYEITVSSVPEPGTLILIGIGLLGLVGLRKKHS
jgi:glutamine cyclotransferase